jgi:surface carbohydrate biosynthesis protein
MSDQKTPILLPIETIVRELDWKLDLAVHLANTQRQIYIGHHDIIHEMVQHLSNGLYVGKNIFASSNQSPRLAELQEKGFTSIYLHEEGGVFKGDKNDWEAVLTSQYDPKLFNENDILCTWGRSQCEFDMTRGAHSVHVTGHPKFDQYRPSKNKVFSLEAEMLVAKYGKIILVNTNFALFNNGNLNTENRALQKNKLELNATEGSSLYSMIALIAHISEHLPDRTVVLRPHPAEGMEIYTQMLSHLPNVIIERKGSLGAWLKAADCLIQNGCTTAIEAYFSGTPVLSYEHQSNLQSYIWLPKQIGDTAKNPQEVCKWITNLSQYKPTIRNSERVEDFIENFRTHREIDFYTLCDDAAKNKKAAQQSFTTAERAVKWRASSLQFRKIVGNLLGKQSTKHNLSKFSLFSKKEIDKRVASFSDVQGRPVCVSVLNPYLFSIKVQ